MTLDGSGVKKDSVFRPRARIMKTLGEELISSDSVALIELVKNSFDADATHVHIRFIGPLLRGRGAIEVFDDGTGMDIDTIRRIWMEPATPSKKILRTSPSGRRVLGEKGIGRFAAARLATYTELISKRSGDQYEAHAEVDWSQFDDNEKYLDEVEILTENRAVSDALGNFFNVKDVSDTNAKKNIHGTCLRMNGLKNDWSEANFQDLRRALSRLISPFSGFKDFSIKLDASDQFERFSEDIGPPEVVKFPHYIVSGEVDSLGEYAINYSVERSGTHEKLVGKLKNFNGTWLLGESNTALSGQSEPKCGPLKIELRVWDRDDLGNIVQITGASISNIRRELDLYAGINIYRDGFRVLPYGEPNNDWLRLDIRRVQNPSLRLSNNQILGYISIGANENPELKDQSNREGLRESDAKQDLMQIMIAVLSHLEAIRKKSRREDSTPVGRDQSGGGLFAKPDLSSFSAHLKESHPADVETQQLIKQIEDNFTIQLDEIKKTVARYHGLVTLGQLIDMLLHQGRQPLSKIVAESTLGKEDLEDHGLAENPILAKLHGRFEKIRTQSAVLDGVFHRVEPFGGRKRGRPGQLYLEKILSDAIDIFADKIEKLGVVIFRPSTSTLVTVDPAELQEVFVNLIQNSLYWLASVEKEKRKIAVQITRTEASVVEIIFADSGPGISDEFKEVIFDPYFSTRPDGTGLGLAVCGDIIRDYYGGSLSLLDTNKLGGAAFQIILRKRV
ncbi:sensor histidine kinase [Duganella sp. S19_KUP01_CR8]|uniref:sensor histidine kinase n=1 Tax=Duganella sp. S19_KUP01_CR8 TaxID=3025502 RepID=UPI002FCD7CAB